MTTYPRLLALLSTALLVLSGCGGSQSRAIRHVIAEDARLAAVRDQEAQSDPPRGIANYCDAVSNVDMTNCPDDFKRAFLRHRNAWSELIPLLSKYQGFWGGVTGFLEGLGGEAHRAEEQLESIRREINESWTEVELIASKHGVNANNP